MPATRRATPVRAQEGFRRAQQLPRRDDVGVSGAHLLYAIGVIAVVLGAPGLLWWGLVAGLSDRVQLTAADGRGVVIDKTSFTSASYSLYLGSGLLYHRQPGSLAGASSEMPPMIADDFALDESGGRLVLEYASERGGARTNRLLLD